MSPATVRSLYQVIHTLKGTASMIRGGGALEQSLHALEAHLTCQPLVESALRLDWLELARESVSRARRALEELSRMDAKAFEERIPKQPLSVSPKGLWVRSEVQGRTTSVWFPLAQILRVFSPEELGARDTLCLQGAWVPVLGRKQQHGHLGIGLILEAGQAVIAVDEVVGVVTWPEAVQHGAVSGIQLPFKSQRAA